MGFFEISKYHTLKKSTYINLRWIGIIGQLISIYLVYFFFNFDFNFFYSNLIIILGIISNLYLVFLNKETQLSDKSALLFLLIDIMQLGFLILLNWWNKKSIHNIFNHPKCICVNKSWDKNQFITCIINFSGHSFSYVLLKRSSCAFKFTLSC